MKQIGILVLGVLILFMFTASVPAKAKIIDVVHLKNGSVIQGTVTVINESIKIETDDGSTFIVEMSKVDKIKKKNSERALELWSRRFPPRYGGPVGVPAAAAELPDPPHGRRAQRGPGRVPRRALQRARVRFFEQKAILPHHNCVSILP